MRSTFVFGFAALMQGVFAYVPLGEPAAPGVMRRADILGNGLFRREALNCTSKEEVCGSQCSAQCCDTKSGLSCRSGEYCVIIDGAVGCCPEGKICNTVKSCVDYSTKGCEAGGAVKGKLCCPKETPYCNKFGNTEYCEAAERPSVNNTLTITASVTSSCHYPNATTTATPSSNLTTSLIPTFTATGAPIFAAVPTPNITQELPTPNTGASTSETPDDSSAAARKVMGLPVVMGGLIIAVSGALFM